MKGGMEGMEDRQGCADYRSYMDRIEVDEGLHSRIMSRIAQSPQVQGVERAPEQTSQVQRAERAVEQMPRTERADPAQPLESTEPVQRESPAPWSGLGMRRGHSACHSGRPTVD